jgi:protein SCO1/2
MRTVALFTLACIIAVSEPTASGSDQRAVPDYLKGVGIDQKLNSQLPLDAQFTDETGRHVTLRGYLGRRPAVFALVYYTCPMLCDQILRGIVTALRPLSLTPGRDFDVIAVSINPQEGPNDAAGKKRESMSLYGKRAAPDGWHFLTGTEPNIHAVADAVGFHYRYDPKTGMFFHAAAIMVLTPEGRAARYFYGVRFEPKDLKLGLIEASHNRIGSPVDAILLFCSHYDPLTGKYTVTLLSALKVGAAVFLLLLVAGLVYMWRHDLRHNASIPEEVRHT